MKRGRAISAISAISGRNRISSGRPRITRVLVVDEYPVVRAGLRALLKAPDMRVVGEAATADEALRLLRARGSHLVVIDVHLPESFDLVRRIKERWPKVSVIMSTSHENTHEVSRAIALGCSGYLHKRTGRRELLGAIRAIARGECVIDPRVLEQLLKEFGGQPPPRRATAPAEPLTVPETQVIRLVTEGRTNREIARELGYSLGTVKDYVQKIIQKLGVSDRTQAAVRAVRLGLVGNPRA